MSDNFGEKLVELAHTPLDESDAPIKAFITNLGKYNEGELVGKWHPFPTTPEAIQRTFREIGIDGVRYEEFFITDYDTDISGLHEPLPEYAELSELNYLAAKIAEMPEYDLNKFEAILESGEYISSLQDLINLTENLDCFDFLPGVEDDEDLGYYWIEESGCYDLSDMGNLARYFDYESFGRDIRIDEGGSYVGGGYVRNTGDSFTEVYDGINVPDEYRIFVGTNEQSDLPMTVLVVEPDKSPREVTVDGSLKSMQELVGGYIQAVYPYDDPVAIVCHEEGKLIGLPLNRAIYADSGQMTDIITGSFFVCGLGGDNFASLPPDMMEKYREQFKFPEKFVSLAGSIVAVKQPVKEAELAKDVLFPKAEKPKSQSPEL